jgi:uncharacterized Zn-binding protein involved in type VI secretion
MPRVARIGDIAVGTCYCHLNPIGTTGVIVTGSSSMYSSGARVARLSDIVLAACGHIGIIVTSSAKASADGRKIARIGDMTSGCFVAVIVTGSPTFSSV